MFNDICAVLTEILDSNVLVVSKKGKILGVSKSNKVREISELITESVGSHIDNMLNERLLSVLSTKENVNLETLGFSADAVEGCQAIITPIDIAGERLVHQPEHVQNLLRGDNRRKINGCTHKNTFYHLVGCIIIRLIPNCKYFLPCGFLLKNADGYGIVISGEMSRKGE